MSNPLAELLAFLAVYGVSCLLIVIVWSAASRAAERVGAARRRGLARLRADGRRNVGGRF